MKLLLWSLVLALLCLPGWIHVGAKECQCDAGIKDNTLYVLFMLTTNKTSYPERGHLAYRRELVLPTIDLALKSLNDSDLLGNYVLKPTFTDVKCDPVIAQNEALDFRDNYYGHAIFGPCCVYVSSAIARLNYVWKMPLITPAALAPDFGKKDLYPEYNSTTRVGPTYINMGMALVEFFQMQNWRTFFQIFVDETNDETNRDHFFLCSGIYEAFYRVGNYSHNFYELNENASEQDIEEALEITGKKSRVVVMCANNDAIRAIMLKAHEMGMTTGEYAFFNIQLFDSDYFGASGWRRNDENDAKAKEAYKALMTLTLRKPDSPSYLNFSKAVKEHALAKYNYSFDDNNQEVNSFVVAFHDAVILYALALNETLEQGYQATDGEEITKRMWNRTFQGIAGVVSIDANGDREADYSLLDMTDEENGEFTVVGNYYGASKTYEETDEIKWPGGSAPLDIPICGFDGCPTAEPSGIKTSEYALITMGIVMVVFAVVIGLVFRRYKYEAQLANMSWKIKWEDILFDQKDKKRIGASRLSLAPSMGSTNTGRPIVSTCNSPTVVITDFHDGIQYCPEFTHEQQGSILLNIMDVESLYTSIPINDGLLH